MKTGALEALKVGRKNPGKRFPNEQDARSTEGLLFPTIEPKFVLDSPAKVFTIGSCFARNIEVALTNYDVHMPTQAFTAPKSEWEFRPNGLLNEYNPATMSRRILSALGKAEEPEETIVETTDGFMDLLLPGGSPVAFERATQRRGEISSVYDELVSSDLVVITLGLVEAWFDHQAGVFLNKMPPLALMKSQPERYEFHQLGVTESLPMLDQAIGALIEEGLDKILLTVSPVPLGTTFTNDDATIANSYSKSVLRVCAQELKTKYPEVDYFPSFEIVTSGGLDSFNDDNIHVKPSLVERATEYMLETYFPEMVAKTEIAG